MRHESVPVLDAPRRCSRDANFNIPFPAVVGSRARFWVLCKYRITFKVCVIYTEPFPALRIKWSSLRTRVVSEDMAGLDQLSRPHWLTLKLLHCTWSIYRINAIFILGSYVLVPGSTSGRISGQLSLIQSYRAAAELKNRKTWFS